MSEQRRWQQAEIGEPAGDAWGFEIWVAVFVLLSIVALGSLLLLQMREVFQQSP